jgi:sterol desaturase/sphingolipid hydroxylase (fatty acid hydroxylase superfamily)
MRVPLMHEFPACTQGGLNVTVLDDTWARLVNASYELVLLSPIFVCIAYVIKRWRALSDGRKAFAETRLNIIYLMLDAALVVPIVVIAIDTAQRVVVSANMRLFDPVDYKRVPAIIVTLFVVLIMDLSGYWRHRLMHTSWLWPAHAIHHSDTEVTWLTLARFQPIDRLITATFDALILAMFGAPGWAVGIGAAVIHYYGYFVHADIPLTYGPLRYALVSPVMHRWHHIRDASKSGNNFATVFAFYDYIFGTYYVPSKEVGDLGIEDPTFPNTWFGQLLYPFGIWLSRIAGDRYSVLRVSRSAIIRRREGS